MQRPQVFMQWPQGLSLVGLVIKACPQLPQPACAQRAVSQRPSPKLYGQQMLERPPPANQTRPTLHAQDSAQVTEVGGTAMSSNVVTLVQCAGGDVLLNTQANHGCA